MADINTGDNEGKKKGRAQKLNTRVDFTPLVDMNMLLLTFFMFCTSMSKPQVMELALPAAPKPNQEVAAENLSKVKDSKTITLILGGDDKVFYYFGKLRDEMYDDPNSLQQTDFSDEGLRGVLLERNGEAIEQMRQLKRRKLHKEISEEEFNSEAEKIKTDPEGQVVIIKPTDDSSYENLIDALDEMQICSIGSYALVDMTEADTYLWQNLMTQGEYGANPENRIKAGIKTDKR